MDTKQEYIELKFGPQWNYISAARSFIQGFLAISTGEQEIADKIAMAASELLENAVKYSEKSETYMKVSIDKIDGCITVQVTNQSTADRCETLQNIFDKIMAKTPLDAYVEQMKEAAVREDGKSQLGLVRIRYEVGADLELQISADYKVSIIVRK